MLVEVNVRFQYNSFKIGFRKEFEMQFPPFYDMVLLDRAGGGKVKTKLSNTGRNDTEIIYTPHKGLVLYTVETTLTWVMPFSNVNDLDVIVGAHLDCGWERTDANNIETIKQTMREQSALMEKYNEPVGRKT